MTCLTGPIQMHRKMPSAKDGNNDHVPWTFSDIVFILFFVAAIDAIFFTLRYYQITSNVYLQALIKIAIPLFWVWHYYPLSFKKIGLQLNGCDRKVSISRLCIIGITWGCTLAIISFSVYGCTIGLVIKSLSPKIAISLLFYSIVYLISANGFLKIVLCPLGEEVLYRGIVFNWLNGRLGFVVAVGITSILYCFSHEDLFSYQPLVRFTIIIMSSICFCYLFIRYKTIYVALIAHAVFNYLVDVIKVLLLAY